jgi:hypothetical protein
LRPLPDSGAVFSWVFAGKDPFLDMSAGFNGDPAVHLAELRMDFAAMEELQQWRAAAAESRLEQDRALAAVFAGSQAVAQEVNFGDMRFALY